MIPKLKDLVSGKAKGHIKVINQKAELSLSLIKRALKDKDPETYKKALEMLKPYMIDIAKLSREIK